MNTLCRRLLITLLVCALPAMAVAADDAPGTNRQTAAPAPAAPQTTPTALPKAPETTAPQTSLPSPATVTPAKSGETPTPQPAIRIGYVDIIRISNDSEPGKAGQVQLVARKKKLQSQIVAKRKQLDKQRAAIEAKLSSLSPQQRDAKGKEFGKKVEEFQKFGQKSEEQLQELQQELSNSLFKKIEQAANDYGKTNGFAAVIVKRELLYAAGGVDVRDVTDEVVKLINGMGSKK